METLPSHKRYPLAEIRRYFLEARQVACQAAEGMTLEEVRQQQETFAEFRLRAEQKRKASNEPQKTVDGGCS